MIRLDKGLDKMTMILHLFMLQFAQTAVKQVIHCGVLRTSSPITSSLLQSVFFLVSLCSLFSYLSSFIFSITHYW